MDWPGRIRRYCTHKVGHAMKDFLRAYWPFLLIGFIGLVIAMRFVDPAPPKHVIFASGSPDGAYSGYAERYKTLLEESGIEVEILHTKGAIENLRLLADGEADIALLQGGLAKPSDGELMHSLGGLFQEPLWVFVRIDIEAGDFGDLKQSRVAIGASGSGTRALAMDIRNEWGSGWSAEAGAPLSGMAAAEALLAGELDAVVYAASIEAPYVTRLLNEPSVRLLPFARASALSRRAPALAPVTLLRGVVDVGADIPSADVPMIAPIAQLGVRNDLHPAIQALLLDAAVSIHSEGSLLARASTFPDPTLTDLPLSKEARRYYQNGPTALRRWFSFSTANFLDRAWVLLIPLLTLMIPLARVAPPIYRWRIRRKIYVWYSDLREIETKGHEAKSAEARNGVRRELEKLQQETAAVEVPLSYNDDLYRLRSHIRFVLQILDFEGKPEETDLVS